MSAENLKPVESFCQIKPLIFSSHQNLDSPNIPKDAITFDLTRHAKLSLTTTTDFMSPTKVLVKKIRFWGVLVLISILPVPCYWLLIVQKIQEKIFKMESSRFWKPSFPITTNLMSSVKISIRCFLLELQSSIRKSVNMYPLWNLDGTELPEIAFSFDTTRYSTFFLQFYLFHLLSSRCQSRKLYTCSNFFVSKHLKICYLHRNWNPDGPEVSKMILVLTHLEILICPSQKLQLWILSSGSELTLSYYCRTLKLKNLRFIPHIGLNSSIKISIDNLVSQKCAPFLKSIVVSSIYDFCVALTENIAVRLRFL